MRLCYLVTLFLLCLAPLYYGRQYAYLYTNDSDKGYHDDMDSDPFKPVEPENTLPAIWKKDGPLGQFDTGPEMGVVIYKPRVRRFWWWIWEGIKAVVSLARMVLDIISPVLTALKSVGFVGALIACVVFPPAGLTALAASAAVSAVHAGVTAADQVLNDGKPHPSLGKVGEVLDQVAQIAGYIDTALALVDLTNPVKMVMKGTKLISMAKNVWKTVKEIPKMVKTLDGFKGVVQSGLSLFKGTGGGKNVLGKVVDAASDIATKVPGLEKVKKVVDPMKRMIHSADKIGEATKILGEMVPFVKKIGSVDDLKSSFDTMKQIGNSVSNIDDAHTAMESFSKIGKAMGTVENAQKAMDVVETISGGAINFDEARSAMGVFGEVSGMLGGSKGAKKGFGALKGLIGKAKSKDGIKGILNVVKDTATKQASVGDFKKTLKQLANVNSFDDAAPLMKGLGVPQDYIDNLDDFKQVMGSFGDLGSVNSIDDIRKITDQFHSLPDKFQDDKLTGAIDGALGVLDTSSGDIKEIFNSMGNIPKTISDPGKFGDLMGSFKNFKPDMGVGIDEMFDTFLTVPRGLGTVEAMKNTFDSLGSVQEAAAADGDDVGEWFGAMEGMSRSAESVDHGPTPIGMMMAEEKSFEDTKAVFGALEQVVGMVKDVAGFKTIMDAFQAQTDPGNSMEDIGARVQSLTDMIQAVGSQGIKPILEILKALTAKVRSVDGLNSILKSLTSVTNFAIDRALLQNTFGILKTSPGIRSSGELLDVLNQLGTFSDSMTSLQNFKEFSQQIVASTGQMTSPQGLTEMLTMAELMSKKTSNTTGIASGIQMIAGISECVKDLKDVSAVLTSISALSKGVLGIPNLGNFFGIMTDMTQLVKTPAGLDTVMQHFVDNANLSKSLKEIGSVYGVMEDRLTRNLSLTNFNRVLTDLKLPQDSLNSNQALLDLVKNLGALVKNVYRRDEIKEMADALKLFPTMALDFQKLQNLNLQAKTLIGIASNVEAIPAIMRAFGELPKGISSLQGARQVLLAFEKLALASKSNEGLRKNAAALSVILTRTKAFDELKTILGFLDQFAAVSNSLEQLKDVLNYLGAVPQEVRSKDQAKRIIDAVDNIVQNCDQDDCLQKTAGFLKSTVDGSDNPEDMRNTLESYQQVADNAPSKEALQGILDGADEIADKVEEQNLWNNTDYIEGWAKDQRRKKANSTRDAKALGKVKDWSDNGNNYEDTIGPMLAEMDAVPPGVKSFDDLKKYTDLVKDGFPNQEEGLTDMEDCARAFERMGEDDKVKEFLSVSEAFQNSPEKLKGVSDEVTSIGSENTGAIQKVPQMVRDVKAAPTIKPQIKELPKYIGPVKKMGVNAVKPITEPLGKLSGVIGGVGSLKKPRAEVVQNLNDNPDSKTHLKGVVGGLEPVVKAGTAPGLKALGSFKKATPPEAKTVFGGVSNVVSGLGSISPIGGLSGLAKLVNPLPHKHQTVKGLGEVMKSMGPVPAALDSVKDFPVAMRMPGCGADGAKNFQKLRDLMNELGVPKEQLDALDAFKEVGDRWRGLPDGPETFEDMARELGPLEQFGADTLKDIGDVLEALGDDADELDFLIPDLTAIQKEVDKTPILEDMLKAIDDLDDDFDELLGLADDHNGWPGLLDWLKGLLDEAEKVTTQDPNGQLPGQLPGAPGQGSATTVAPGSIGQAPTTQDPNGQLPGQVDPNATPPSGAVNPNDLTTQKPNGLPNVTPVDPNATPNPLNPVDPNATPLAQNQVTPASNHNPVTPSGQGTGQVTPKDPNAVDPNAAPNPLNPVDPNATPLAQNPQVTPATNQNPVTPSGQGTGQVTPVDPNATPNPLNPVDPNATPSSGAVNPTRKPNGQPDPNATVDPNATPSGQNPQVTPASNQNPVDPNATPSSGAVTPDPNAPGGLVNPAVTPDPNAQVTPSGQGTGPLNPVTPGNPNPNVTPDPNAPGGPGVPPTTQDPNNSGQTPATQDPNNPSGQKTTTDPNSSNPGSPTQNPTDPSQKPGDKTTASGGPPTTPEPPGVVTNLPPLPTSGKMDTVINYMIQLRVLPVEITRIQRDEISVNFEKLSDHEDRRQHLLKLLPEIVNFGGIPKVEKLVQVMEPFKDTQVLPELANLIKSLPSQKAPEFLDKMKKVLGWMGGDQERIDVISDMGDLLGDLSKLTGGVESIAKILPSSLGAMAKLPQGFGSLMDKISAKSLIEQMPDGSGDLKKLIGMMEHMDGGGGGKDLIGKLGGQFMKLTGLQGGLDVFSTISDMMGMFTGDKEANGFVDVFKSFTGLAKGLTGGFDPISGLFDFLGGGLGSLDPGGLISGIGSLIPGLGDGIGALGSFSDVLGGIGGLLGGNPVQAISGLTGVLGKIPGLGGVVDGIGSVVGAASSIGGMLGIGGSGGAAAGAGAGGLTGILGSVGGLLQLGGLAGSAGGLMGTLSTLAPLALAFGRKRRATHDPRGALNFLSATSQMFNDFATPDPAFQGAWPLTWAKPEWRPPIHHWRMFVEGHVTMQDAVDHLNCVLQGCSTAATLPGFTLPPLNQIPLSATPTVGAPPPPSLVTAPPSGPGIQNPPAGSGALLPTPAALQHVSAQTCAQWDRGHASANFQCSDVCAILALAREKETSESLIKTILMITAGVMCLITVIIMTCSCVAKMKAQKRGKGEKLESSDDVEMAFEATNGTSSSSRSKNSKEKGSKEKKTKSGSKTKTDSMNSKRKDKKDKKDKKKDQKKKNEKTKKDKKKGIPKSANKLKTKSTPKNKKTGADMKALTKSPR